MKVQMPWSGVKNKSMYVAKSLLWYYSKPYNLPMTEKEFYRQVSGTVLADHASVLDKYLVLCNDGVVRVRSIEAISAWAKRHQDPDYKELD